MTGRLPWEIIETLPSSDAALVVEWDARADRADGDAELARARVGQALSLYWASQEGVVEASWADLARRRAALVGEALDLARATGDVDVVAEALLGHLYALWGPDHLLNGRRAAIDELRRLQPKVRDDEVRLRIREWAVGDCLDAGALGAAREEIERFARERNGADTVLFWRREELWRGNLAMLEGRIDEALRINQSAVSSTAETAGSPFSFQNVAITIAIERFFRRGLRDTIDAIRSVRASSPRVATNWDTGLAFALAEVGELDEAAQLFESVAVDGFARVHRDLNWLVTMQLLGLIALHLDDRARAAQVLALLRPFAALDATHGSGYASYGPVGRVVGALSARIGEVDEAERWFDFVLRTREPGPWTSLTRLDRARASRAWDPSGAAHDASRAERELRDFELDGWADVARALDNELAVDGHGGPVASLDRGMWTLRHPVGSAEVADGVGIGYLTTLLARPGEPIGVTTLDRDVHVALPATSAAMESIDATARAAYRARLDVLDQIARPLTDAERAERDLLRRELAGAAFTPAASAEVERARVRVTKAIRRTIDAVARQSPALGGHLDQAVQTGRQCMYAPLDGTAWRIASSADAKPG